MQRPRDLADQEAFWLAYPVAAGAGLEGPSEVDNDCCAPIRNNDLGGRAVRTVFQSPIEFDETRGRPAGLDLLISHEPIRRRRGCRNLTSFRVVGMKSWA